MNKRGTIKKEGSNW